VVNSEFVISETGFFRLWSHQNKLVFCCMHVSSIHALISNATIIFGALEGQIGGVSLISGTVSVRENGSWRDVDVEALLLAIVFLGDLLMCRGLLLGLFSRFLLLFWRRRLPRRWRHLRHMMVLRSDLSGSVPLTVDPCFFLGIRLGRFFLFQILNLTSQPSPLFTLSLLLHALHLSPLSTD
jgi:hypothetical protein